MKKNQTTVIVLVVALFLVCNLVACVGGLIGGSALRAIRMRRWTGLRPMRPMEREIEPQVPTPRRPQEWPEQIGWGALVLEVTEDSPAADARIETGDLIVAIDGEPIEEDSDLREWLAEFEPGDRVKLTVRRGAREAEVQVRLGRRMGESDEPYLGLTYRLIPVPRPVD
jgi:S1-C subfamily serine protease